jgi:uncharacterized protein YndB with AHSA1/START domain
VEPIEFRHEVLVEAPADEVFRACDSARDQTSWVGSLVAVELDTEAPWGAGARFRQIHEEGGVRQVLEGELLEHVPGERIVMRLEHPDFELETVIRFESLGALTRVDQATRLTLKSLALRLAAPMVRAAVDRRIGDDMARLKALVEQA